MKKVLVIGGGGREHALARGLSKSQHVEKVFVCPGNPGMCLGQDEQDAPIECVPISGTDIPSLVSFAQSMAIDLTVVGPEQSICAGVVDAFLENDLPILGPTKKAAQIESSKKYAKEQMKQAGVRCADYQSFSGRAEDMEQALDYMRKQSLPIVIKQDGLAAGKGVIIAQSYEEAAQTIEDFVDHGEPFIIEEFLTGEEFSFFTLVNGSQCIPLMAARDYKRAFDQDQGKNTGGMGAFSPVPFVDELLAQRVQDEIVQPLMDHLVAIGNPYTGVLYTGAMLNDKGIYVIEFNARFGDPETQIMLQRIKNDLYELFAASVHGQKAIAEMNDNYCLGVVVAAEGYPQKAVVGQPLLFTEDFAFNSADFAGVARDEQGQLIANGGRLFMVLHQAPTLAECRRYVYEQLSAQNLPYTFYRKDIGEKFAKETDI
ncbi:phosphoribosylamine--glycine ligase [Allofustis seminis]|uniref:phosphoribosylamine--glycine ligase n=1 Tax=Allofustis seminis TaxID=166939 RepID=UPI000379E4EB|nr:phosphoribosylamine--glycine ligase [Allofustis seminis]